jgi:hypothetical protein
LAGAPRGAPFSGAIVFFQGFAGNFSGILAAEGTAARARWRDQFDNYKLHM